MERYLCIHGHFYQPPRENPWLEAIEIQDSAHPYHDWNERITAECYAPNSASRILGLEGRIIDIVSNYSRISFNFGPTLLSWIEKYTPEIYQAVLNADRQSIEWRSGHGNAISQAYNHIIMPLANKRDKLTQVIWGIKDFEHRFKRMPEGMWLPETAVDIETLEILAEKGMMFTILAPRQALRVRRIGAGRWKDISGGRIDPTRAYLCRLPSGRQINIFFYDGPISQAVAFEKILNKGEDFANRLLSGFSEQREWPQIIHIATDGESYGHHHKFGDMALAYSLNHIESNGLARLTNYGEYLDKHPPTHEVEIIENSSWSCIHGIERWRSSCGCNSGGHPEWSQEWRLPLRQALDWLREHLSAQYEQKAAEYLKAPWQARDEYIDIILNRSEENIERFFESNSNRALNRDEKISAIKLLEMQRHAMLMYTSCGWFFDEISGIETVQVLQYATRAIQLFEGMFGDSIENIFRIKLSEAKSNLPEFADGANIYEKIIKPSMIDLKKVAVHYAVSSIFEDYVDKTDIFSYEIKREEHQRTDSERASLALGKVYVSSKITLESELISFCVLNLGNHDLNGGVRGFISDDAYNSMKDEIASAFKRGGYTDIVRLMDRHFGMNNYSLTHLFRDEQRRILEYIISETLKGFEGTYRGIYDNNSTLMGFLNEIRMPVPKPFYAAVKFILNLDIKNAFADEVLNVDKVQALINEMKKWDITFASVDIEFTARHRLEEIMKRLQPEPFNLLLLTDIQKALELLRLLPVDVNYWQVQNSYFNIAKKAYHDIAAKAASGDKDAGAWLASFKYIGELLNFNIDFLFSK